MLLSLHAGWIGRRKGAKVAARVREAVADAVTTVGFSGLDAVEAARRRLAAASKPNLRLAPRKPRLITLGFGFSGSMRVLVTGVGWATSLSEPSPCSTHGGFECVLRPAS